MANFNYLFIVREGQVQPVSLIDGLINGINPLDITTDDQVLVSATDADQALILAEAYDNGFIALDNEMINGTLAILLKLPLNFALVGKCFIDRSSLQADLEAVKAEAATIEPDIPDDYTSIDVRLRVHGKSWYLYTGDASYDQDHRGYIGASSIDADSNTAEVLEDLIDQCLDVLAEDQANKENF